MIDYNAIESALKEFWLRVLADVPRSSKLSDMLTRLMIELVRGWINKMKRYKLKKFTATAEMREMAKELLVKLENGDDISDEVRNLVDMMAETETVQEEDGMNEEETEEPEQASEEEALEEEPNEEQDEENLVFEANLMTATTFYRADTGEMVEWNNEVLAQVKENFEEGIVHFDIPVNIEHEPQWGVVGHVRGLNLRDGKLYAQIELLPGYEWVKESFKYLSAEIAEEWTHPSTGQKYSNVLVGVALTNYPASPVEPFNLSQLLERAVKAGVPAVVVGEFKKMLNKRKYSTHGRRALLDVFGAIVQAYESDKKITLRQVKKDSSLSLPEYMRLKYGRGA